MIHKIVFVILFAGISGDLLAKNSCKTCWNAPCPACPIITPTPCFSGAVKALCIAECLKVGKNVTICGDLTVCGQIITDCPQPVAPAPCPCTRNHENLTANDHPKNLAIQGTNSRKTQSIATQHFEPLTLSSETERNSDLTDIGNYSLVCQISGMYLISYDVQIVNSRCNTNVELKLTIINQEEAIDLQASGLTHDLPIDTVHSLSKQCIAYLEKGQRIALLGKSEAPGTQLIAGNPGEIFPALTLTLFALN